MSAWSWASRAAVTVPPLEPFWPLLSDVELGDTVEVDAAGAPCVWPDGVPWPCR